MIYIFFGTQVLTWAMSYKSLIGKVETLLPGSLFGFRNVVWQIYFEGGELIFILRGLPSRAQMELESAIILTKEIYAWIAANVK